ncbi:NAD(P)-dependent oxidoreductase [Nakamurella sp. PAMC28650]|jgi:nucleoside-diphosphate-sugar epimerase|uniref:NAD-dependent epimerase/dehydratase family protein n=1 Tax=Nakamurella sp. PAMC28650 TaxID=2762325 RepID=UPI00164D3ECB|nr:NAD-dependent epimerase/dehydratase family protein [Nakamurella sp. PAMC28650]QNK80022.1 NAD-dependent epimerase/dehydratase family protein [Nakamurella sp. PAMC28650]
MRVLLTGAGGMMGGATAQALAARGDDVTVLQRRPARLGLREVLGDIADLDVVRRAARGQDVVVHAAAKVDVFGRWADFRRTNVEGTACVVEACRAEGVGRLVNVSSPSVAHAGHALIGVGAGPADPGAARGDYARSKAMAEELALAADRPDLAVLCIRPHLVWGAADSQLVQPVIERARAGRLPLIGDGTALVDTTYVDNAVGALLAAVDACGPVHGQSFVVTNGEPRPVGEIIRRVCRAAGVAGPRGRLPLGLAVGAGAAVESLWRLTGRTGRPPMTRFLAEQLGTAHWFDQRRTREALSWTPLVDLEQGFELLRQGLQP